MGSLRDTMEKLPFFHDMVPEGAAVDEKVLGRIEAMINSMTPDERKTPNIIDDRRARRIAKGSGRKPNEVKDLVQRFEAMREVMKRVGKQPSLLGRLPGFKEALDLAKARGEDVSDLMPSEREQRGSWGGYGVRKLNPAEKERRRKRKSRQSSDKGQAKMKTLRAILTILIIACLTGPSAYAKRASDVKYADVERILKHKPYATPADLAKAG